VGTWGAGVNRINTQTGIITRFNSQLPQSALVNDFVSALFQDRDGDVWVGTAGGVSLLHLATGTSTHFKKTPENPRALGGNFIRSFWQDGGGTMWIAAEQGGVTLLDKKTGYTEMYRHEPTNAASLSNDNIRCIFPDKQGALWFGALGGGLNKFDPYARKFLSYRQEVNNPFSLNNNVVRAIAEDDCGTVWVGTEGGGLSKFDPAAQRFTAYRHDPANPQSISHDVVRGIAYDKKRGVLWIATGGGGLNCFEPKRGIFKTYRVNSSAAHSISNDFVRPLLLNADGTLWVGTEGGLNHFDPATERFTAYHSDANDPHSLSFDVVLSLYRDRSGALWVGTLQGLNKFDSASRTFTQFPYNTQDAHTLQSGNIRSMLEDSKGRFWVGTWGGGLNLFDRTTGRAEVFREKDGLPNDAVYGIMQDSMGGLWLTTNNGLARFNPETRAFRTYDADDGLQSNEFNSGAYHVGASGRFYIGGVNGLSIFSPQRITDNTTPPPVVITGFKKFNKPVQLWQDLTSEPEITIPYDDNFFSIEFAALNFTNARKNQYLYKLDGFDKHWIDAGTSREAAYTNLDPGAYTFRVKACNNDGHWNERGAKLHIRILPPWWMTLWFRAGMALCFVGTGGAWFWARWRRVHHQKRELERQVSERTEQLQESNLELSQANEEIQLHIQTVSEQAWEIATMNTQLNARNQELERLNVEKNEFLGIAAHDLKNPLSGILSSAEILERYYTNNPATERFTSMIIKSSDQMLEIITNILDVNRIESGLLSFDMEPIDLEILELIIDAYQARAADKGILLHYEHPEQHVSVLADSQSFRQVFDNLISNAVKYSPHGKNITVRVKDVQSSHTENGIVPSVADESAKDTTGTNVASLSFPVSSSFVRIEVQDEGPGISDEDMKRLFGKFARLSAQPTGGEHSTGLGLSIVKKMVEAMQGRVWCESELGAGATFVVELPKAEQA
jgi:signal transduction histidine kinase/ligand-binding sensor domain-containing protein